MLLLLLLHLHVAEGDIVQLLANARLLHVMLERKVVLLLMRLHVRGHLLMQVRVLLV